MSDQATTAIVLAAGVGSRFHSNRPKVVHTILGKPLVAWVVNACEQAGIRSVSLVASPDTQPVLADALPDATIAIQPEPKGTGDAAAYGLESMGDVAEGCVVVAAGDTPCITPQTISQVCEACSETSISVLTCSVETPAGYGRIVRNSDGTIENIVEHKDADADTLAIREINAGLYAFPITVLRQELKNIGTDNAQGEKYLVDVIRLARAKGIHAMPVMLTDEQEIQGVNDRHQLEHASRTLRDRINTAWQRAGVTICHPDTVDIGPDVVLDSDVSIDAQVQLLGSTHIKQGCSIAAGCVITDSTIEADCEIKPYVVIDRTSIQQGSVVGPFAHLRPGTELGEKTKIGNFVETKNTSLDTNSKANHLAYLGDAVIGKNVNVGAGTITCNYDGANKHQTVLEDDVFIGSDTQLVAPVRVGKGATVGAGTTVRKDVSDGALAVSHAPQKEFPDYQRKNRKT